MAEKTEPPSPKRIRDARKKGQFLVSREIVSGSTLAAVCLALYITREHSISAVFQLLQHAADVPAKPFPLAFSHLLTSTVHFFILVTAIAVAPPIILSIIANVSQTGPVFSVAKLSKGLQAVNAFNNLKQIFSKRNLFTFFLNVCKIAALAAFAFLLIVHFIKTLAAALQCGLPCSLEAGVAGVVALASLTLLLYIPLAVLDYLFQRRFYLQELRMSKDEVKREFKEMEGNPEIKAQRRQIHQEALNTVMLETVRKKASFVVKNPTHFAVALFHDEDNPVPRVIGKGSGALALAILNVAKEADIPVYQNVQLARDLHELEIGRHITLDLVRPIVEALHFIESLKQRLPTPHTSHLTKGANNHDHFQLPRRRFHAI